MRWFWLFIALLVVLTGVLTTQRVRREHAQQLAAQAQAESSAPSTMSRRARASESPGEQPATQPEINETVAEVITEPSTPVNDEPRVEELVEALPKAEPVGAPKETQAGVETPQIDEVVADEVIDESTIAADPAEPSSEPALAQADPEPQLIIEPEPQPEPEPELEQEIAQTSASTPPAQTQQTQTPETQIPDPQTPPQAPAPSFEARADGSFRIIDENIVVKGAGTQAQPYVLGWDALKSIEKHYNPKKGQDKIPDWINHLDGKVVSIEGNTLVPVVATTTRELLIMKNPWDGCCIGVPPTPYDAIEVVLNHDVDFGNSAVGFGSVQGIFYLDPYIVDGWVLGLYIIEDARYRSGEGVVFPEF